jgi:glycosyltransferase involved in cell wall biosynthesis
MPALLRSFPELHLVVVGGPSQEGDWTAKLEAQVATLGLQRCVRFLGPVAPERLPMVMSAADVFVLATSNEGWANVFLEAMACGLPVVTTRVGGNAEVVCDETLGIVVPFGDGDVLREAIDQALRRDWDRRRIRCHAERNAWERRVEQLVDEFHGLAQPRCAVARTRLAQTS